MTWPVLVGVAVLIVPVGVLLGTLVGVFVTGVMMIVPVGVFVGSGLPTTRTLTWFEALPSAVAVLLIVVPLGVFGSILTWIVTDAGRLLRTVSRQLIVCPRVQLPEPELALRGIRFELSTSSMVTCTSVALVVSTEMLKLIC